VESDVDEQLIIHIPFTGAIKLKSIIILGGNGGQAPSKLKIFTNRDDIDFSNVSDISPVQEWDLVEAGEIEYPTKIAKFNNVTDLTIYISDNYGANTTKIYYIGFKGDFTPVKRQAVTAVYESKPQAKDHQTPADQFSPNFIQ